VHYPIACHRQAAYANGSWPHLPVAERLQNEILSLPLAPYMTLGDIDMVLEVVKKFA
jgi:dTDP-4-amino-4,6-dideoxygalactose transaminase